jgi:hypothetical protein
MKKFTSKLLTISLLSVIIFTSCSKQEDVMTTQTILLVQKDWKVEFHGLDENNNNIIEASENSMLPCEEDDLYTFNVNCTGVFSGGTMPCSAGEPPVISFNWRFLNNGTELAVFAAPEKINRLDEDFLEVYYMDENSVGQPVKYIRRFRH